MKKTPSLIICLLFVFSGWGQSVYQYSIKTIEGTIVPIASYQGKKILIITLPMSVESTAITMLRSLDSLSASYTGTLQVIGFPASEDGYPQNNIDSLYTWYRSILGPLVVISKVVYSHKKSGIQQDALFKWLTNKNLNGHFNSDVSGIFNEFILWTDGQLIAAMKPGLVVNMAAVKEILDTP